MVPGQKYLGQMGFSLEGDVWDSWILGQPTIVPNQQTTKCRVQGTTIIGEYHAQMGWVAGTI